MKRILIVGPLDQRAMQLMMAAKKLGDDVTHCNTIESAERLLAQPDTEAFDMVLDNRHLAGAVKMSLLHRLIKRFAANNPRMRA